ncbi:MAG: acyl-ACP--UDP-N-acetylglucosamine O-acyltransferase [Verrucomicrobiales bacterium]|jgi:UDP-N-acetylglucosamine acyltransferase|nr:acyl-ACP--UDP-N-acetylglucosamine O-acyltransferase [Verrucomicrobiales bacterium]
MSIHPTAIVSPKAKLGDNVEVGPYCIIGDNVKIGDNCRLIHHVNIEGYSKIGAHNLFHPFCTIGTKTQDLKYKGEPTWLIMGDHNEFREFTSVNRGTSPEEKTIIGNHNLFLTYSHVAHNCEVGNHCILSNNGTLGGHVIVEDYVIISGLAAVHQFCRVGQHSMIGGCSKIVQDVPPYFIADGNPADVRAVNTVGLQRRGFTEEQIALLRRARRTLYDANLNTSQALTLLEEELGANPEVQVLINFVRNSQRGIIR